MHLELFQELDWRPDYIFYRDLKFRIEQAKSSEAPPPIDCFDFYKGKWTIEQYTEFWNTRRDFLPERVIELGIWDGGSSVFWYELLQPRKHVALDIAMRDDSAYFRKYIEQNDLQANLITYWGTDQTDAPKLRDIVAREFSSQLDLVLDDASHAYAATKASFEILFPYLRPGGLYIIEDWAWAFWKEFQTPNNPWHNTRPLADLIVELVQAVGSTQVFAPRVMAGNSETVWQTPISNLVIFPHFVVVERGDRELDTSGAFHLEDFISRPQIQTTRLSLKQKIVRRAKNFRSG